MSRLSSNEEKNVRAFVSLASDIAGGQSALARLTGVAQSTIGGVLADRGAGGRTLRALSRALNVSVDDILSGIGAYKLRAQSGTAIDQANVLARVKATRALAELFDLSVAEVAKIFDEIGLVLPDAVPATVWFDTGRSAIERQRAGLNLLKR